MEMVNQVMAFTITRDYAKKDVWKVKKCYYMRHPELKEVLWNTKIDTRLQLGKSTISDIAQMFEDMWQLPYIENIQKGDVVSLKHKMILSTWHVVWDQYHNNRSVCNEV